MGVKYDGGERGWMMDDRLTDDESRVGLLEAREVPKVRGLAELVASRVVRVWLNYGTRDQYNAIVG